MTPVPALMVAYYFPPTGGAGTQRSSKFAKWLPAYGYRPVVVAGAPRASASAPHVDPSLARDLPDGTTVVRVARRGSAPMGATRRALLAARFRVDREEWAAAAFGPALRAGRTHGAGVVMVSASPYAAADLGRRLARALDVPWVLDLRDPWALDGWRVYPTRLHARYDRARMRAALGSADLVIANTRAARAAFVELTGLPEDRFVTIPNGFDADDFAIEPEARDPGPFRLIHAGWLHDPHPRSRRPLAHRWRELDETGRSGRYLLGALALLRSRRPDLARRLEVHLAGHAHPGNLLMAERLGVSELIVERGHLDHDRSVRALLASDAVFVPLSAVADGEEALVVPGKLYEGLASGRPLLAALPPGDGRRLVEATGAGVVCAPDDPGEISDGLERLIEARSSGGIGGAHREALEPFTRRSLAGRLAGALDFARGEGPRPADDPWSALAIGGPPAPVGAPRTGAQAAR